MVGAGVGIVRGIPISQSHRTCGVVATTLTLCMRECPQKTGIAGIADGGMIG